MTEEHDTEYGRDHQPFNLFGGFITRKKFDKEVQKAIDGNFSGLVVRKVDEIRVRVQKVIKILLNK
ncbi:MAG: hypothetical protein NTY75_01865 [Candidatus Shapirobacteria bacterium]|nr:hypothetical protein [Candidatus Shapirobacteria bacterium]